MLQVTWLPRYFGATHNRIDLSKVLKPEYAALTVPALVHIPKGLYLSVDGQGDPAQPEFASCLEAVYSLAFTIRISKKFEGVEYQVGKLEALWWGVDETKRFIDQDRTDRRWRLLIRTPRVVNRLDLAAAVATLRRRGKGGTIESVVLNKLQEGQCVQCLHVGSHLEERFTIDQMDQFCTEHGYQMSGHHHEIYLSDPRRTHPQRLRTVLRWPVTPRV